MASVFVAGAVGIGITPMTPGCAVAISDHGSVVYSQGFGLANRATKSPITPMTVMDIGSISKQFVAASILLLAQSGKLSLSDDIHKYVPELPSYGTPMPLQDLLWMESGIPDYLNANLMANAGYKFTDRVTAAQQLTVIAKIDKLDFAPGSEYAYSNTNYFLLGLVVSRVSGESLAAFLQSRFFGPLGMNASSLVDGSVVPTVGAPSYDLSTGPTLPPVIWPWDSEGPGGIHSTVLDLLRWAQNFTTGTVGGPALLKAQLQAGLANVGLIEGRPSSYAFGLVLSTHNGHRLIWHDGGWESFRSALLIAPESGRALAMVCNSSAVTDPYGLAVQALDAWFGP